jgi:hypothetical protein
MLGGTGANETYIMGPKQRRQDSRPNRWKDIVAIPFFALLSKCYS